MEQITWFKKHRQRAWTDIFPKKIYKWPTGTWKCSALLITRKIQIKTTKRCHFTPDRMKVTWKWVTQLCPTLCDPMDHSPPGPPVHVKRYMKVKSSSGHPQNRRISKSVYNRDLTAVSLSFGSYSQNNLELHFVSWPMKNSLLLTFWSISYSI